MVKKESANKEFLLEIGTEEIPAAALDHALKDLKRVAMAAFEKHRVSYAGLETYGTPRMLILFAPSMPESQPDIVIEKKGPAKSVAYDKDGAPTRAAIGFARGQGVDVSELCIITESKGEYIGVKKKQTGVGTLELLGEILPQMILSIPFKKSMRWSDQKIRFIRPIHWIVALFGDDVINFTVGKIKSGRLTVGHRFLSPSKFTVKNFKHFKSEMKHRHVMIDSAERKRLIQSDIAKIQKLTGLELIQDDELLDHVANLVEHPVTVYGSFDQKFLELPDEVLINSMREHQKYFSMKEGGSGNLTNTFINIANTIPRDVDVVIKGNERVLRARLSDAEFFYNEDKKRNLESYNEQLKGVTFHNKLGSMYEKVLRIVLNAKFIADAVSPDTAKDAERAALLCKADLVTEMVGEFPKLQGVMGREYAKLRGESREIAQAVYEHYLPTGADSSLPRSDIGAIVSIADKIDTIVGCFSVGLVPTGSADPFALRRQTLGIMNILLDKKYAVSLSALVTAAYENVSGKAKRSKDETVDDVMDFFESRFKNAYSPDRYSYDVIDAVLASGLDNVTDSLDKIQALSEFKNRDDFEALAISFKRVANIVKGVTGELTVTPSLFNDKSEHALFDKFNEVRARAVSHSSKGEYLKALEVITKLKGPVDDFFDDVLVMTDDEAVKNNRLGLLQSVQSIFRNIADFSKLKG